jgi:hypothetical protein
VCGYVGTGVSSPTAVNRLWFFVKFCHGRHLGIQARRGASRRSDLDDQDSQGQKLSEQAAARHGLAQGGHSHEQAVGPVCKLATVSNSMFTASFGGGRRSVCSCSWMKSGTLFVPDSQKGQAMKYLTTRHYVCRKRFARTRQAVVETYEFFSFPEKLK